MRILRKTLFGRIAMLRPFSAALRTAVFLLAAACAAPSPVAPERLSTIKSVGIISAIGDQFTFTSIGMTVFGDEGAAVPIEPWAMDDYVVDDLGSALAKRYEVKSVTYKKADFLSVASRQDLGETVRKSVSPQSLDAYIVVSKANERWGLRGETMAGLGFVQGPSMSARLYYIHAIYTLTVIDGRDFKVIASAYPKQPGGDGVTEVAWPHREVGSSWWVANPRAMTERQRQRLQDALKSLIASTGPNTLRAMKLID